MVHQPEKGDAKAVDRLIQDICSRLAQNKRVRRNLPGGGRLRIDRPLPFLCVYRYPPDRDDLGTVDLVTTEASYLFISGDPQHHETLIKMCARIGATLTEQFGTFLILEVWADDGDRPEGDDFSPPAFRIVTPDRGRMPTTIDAFTKALLQVKNEHLAASLEVREDEPVAPPGMPQIVPPGSVDDPAPLRMGLAVRPFYRSRGGAVLYPIVLRKLRRRLAVALRKTFFTFTGSTRDGIPHYHTLGPTSFVRAAAIVDKQLCDVAESFDYLLQITPTNTQIAWNEFRNSKYRDAPLLRYRPLPHNPVELKQTLFQIPIERIEDTTIAHLFWEKQEELDRRITSLRDAGTPAFLFGSVQIYGEVEPDLLQIACELLTSFPPTKIKSDAALIDAHEMAESARQEINRYRRTYPGFYADVQIRDDIASGMMVSQNRVLVSESLRVQRARQRPLLHHEIGTHLLTYVNGTAQPFHILHSGLAGYESLQEGLAVLAEHLGGGLSPLRIRTLAARVVAASMLLHGASFLDTFDRLHREFKLPPRRAFTTTLRAYRGGGTTKDVIYLRGLKDLVRYLSEGHDIEPLYVGKIALAHVPLIQELRRRQVLLPPSVMPRYLTSEKARERLAACRGKSLREFLGVYGHADGIPGQ